MKLLLYSHYFAPSIGGVETIVQSLASGLAELRSEDGTREFEVTLVTQTPRGDFDDAALPFRVVRRPRMLQLVKLVRDADVLHLAGPSFFPMLLAKLAGKPYAVEHHNYQAICPNGLLIHMPDRAVCPGHFQAGNYRTCWKCESAEKSRARSFGSLVSAFPRWQLVRTAAKNIAVSRHVQDRIGAPRSSVIYHGIESGKEASEFLDRGLGAGEKICFAYVGRFVPDKGAGLFVEALAQVRKQRLEFRAMLIGDGPERADLQTRIEEEGLKSEVELTGFLSGEALATALTRVHVVVMPSVGEETAGLAAIEQMMRGRMVIYAAIGGLPEVIGDAGMKFVAGDTASLAACLAKIIEMPAVAGELGMKARERARANFVLTRMVEQHASLYQTLLRSKNSIQ